MERRVAVTGIGVVTSIGVGGGGVLGGGPGGPLGHRAPDAGRPSRPAREGRRRGQGLRPDEMAEVQGRGPHGPQHALLLRGLRGGARGRRPRPRERGQRACRARDVLQLRRAELLPRQPRPPAPAGAVVRQRLHGDRVDPLGPRRPALDQVQDPRLRQDDRQRRRRRDRRASAPPTGRSAAPTPT